MSLRPDCRMAMSRTRSDGRTRGGSATTYALRRITYVYVAQRKE